MVNKCLGDVNTIILLKIKTFWDPELSRMHLHPQIQIPNTFSVYMYAYLQKPKKNVLPSNDMVFWLTFLWMCSSLSMKFFCRLEANITLRKMLNCKFGFFFLLVVIHAKAGLQSVHWLTCLVSRQVQDQSRPWWSYEKKGRISFLQ